jgi:MFS family permease
MRHRNYRLYFAGMIVSQAGTWMQSLGQQWLVLSLTNSALWLGIVAFCTSIPVLLLTMFGGVVADRVNKRYFLMCTQSAAALQAVVLGFLTSSGRVQVWQVVACALALGTINAFDVPARQAFVVDMVGKEDLANAIALNSSIFNGARIFGPAIAGVLIAVPQVGMAGVFYLNGITFLALIFGLVLMDVKAEASVARLQSIRANLTEGLGFARQERTVGLLMLTASVTSIFGVSYGSMLPIFAENVLHVGSEGQGIMMTFIGIGAVIGSLAVATVASTARKGRIWTIGSLIFPPSLIILAISRSFPLTLAGLFMVGFGLIVQNAMTNTLLQTSSPDALRGRVMGLYNLTFQGMTPFGSLQVGVVANAFGAPLAVGIGGLLCLSRSLWVLLRHPEVRKLP